MRDVGIRRKWIPLGSGSGAFNNSTIFNIEDNFTLSCAARNIQGPVMLPYPTALVTIVRALQSISFLLLFLFSATLNILLVTLIAKYKKLQTLPFGCALQIVVLNLINTILVYLGGFISSLANRWLFGEHVCVAAGMVTHVSVVVRTLLLFVFVIDQFLSVFLPFVYPKRQLKLIVILSIASWTFSIASGFASIPQLLDCYIFSSFFWLCTFSSECNRACSYYSNVFYSLVTIPAICVPIVLYIALYVKARMFKKHMARLSEGAEHGKKDWKATITFFILFISIFALTLPSITLNVIINRFYKDSEEEPPVIYVLSVISIIILSLLPVTDAIVIMRNKDVREVLNQIKVKLIKKSSTGRKDLAILSASRLNVSVTTPL